MAEPWTIEFYRDDNGSSPVQAFIDGLDRKMRAKVFWTISLLRGFGPNLPMPYARPISGYEFREIRVQQASNITRVFFVARSGRVIVLLHGFIKKTETTPKRELAIAQRRLTNLRER